MLTHTIEGNGKIQMTNFNNDISIANTFESQLSAGDERLAELNQVTLDLLAISFFGSVTAYDWQEIRDRIERYNFTDEEIGLAAGRYVVKRLGDLRASLSLGLQFFEK